MKTKPEFAVSDLHPSLEEQEAQLHKLHSHITSTALQTLLREKLGLSLASFARLDKSRGVVNPIYLLTATSGRQFVLRLRNPHKYWRGIRTIAEVNAMRLVRGSTTIPVPAVLDFASDEAASAIDCEYILMDHLPGATLTDLIPDLTHAQRLSVLGEVLACIKKLQDIPLETTAEQVGTFSVQPGDYKSLGPIIHDGPSLGPFRNFADYCAANVQHALFCIHNVPDRFEHLVSPLQEFVQRAKFGHTKNVLCHLDFNPGNVLVDPATLQVTAVLDWEHARVCPWELEFYAAQKYACAYQLSEKHVEQLCGQAGVMLGPPDKEIGRANEIVDCANGLHFFCATWYQHREKKEDRVMSSLRDGAAASEKLCKMLLPSNS